MQDDIYQQLSAYVDEELGRDERRFLERRLESDEELRAALARYYAIGAAARNESAPEAAGLADRVRRHLEAEAPHERSEGDTSGKWRRVFFMAQPIGGIAIAASVALALVVAWPLVPDPTRPDSTSSTVQIAAEPTVGTLSRVGGQASQDPVANDSLDEQLRRQLQPYFMDHNDQSATRPIGGTLESVRTIGHDAER
ncbi:sigma-E factor negative regulatory protein [Spiribacter vilamensis]|uniref:Sigma-E factor negative regulatory protein RseA n=1 Tax=Spiribacter vilamensis TaxID=531306 RepID=A0A4Q8CYW5_9GAMM|nr:sigma-E factor negative regulatory protein [Spiribacter vilamensis]RZU98183.1 sigma-E factor negative regulatory protein RseA [Spiribacter vilamensis]TVO60916.1 hypothetical protein FPL09_01805 [Spiribacter vilamensis]